jgi:uncharacterized membrane protein YgdD (TMEM256/DUF423 family)
MIAFPPMNSTNAFRISAALGFLGVALGAFGAHGLKTLLEQHNAADIWKTASEYHLIHAVVMLWLAGRKPLASTPWMLFLAGIIMFSGSLYLYAALGTHWLALATPLGGLCFLAGWGWLVAAGDK